MTKQGWTLILLGGLALAAAILSPLASPFPDGLEATLERTDSGETAPAAPTVEEPLIPSPWPDYDLTGDGSPLSGILAGLAGAAVALGLGWLIFRLLRPKKTTI